MHEARTHESQSWAGNAQPKRTFAPKKAGPAKPAGHEAFLKALEAGGALVTVRMATDGAELKGTIKHSDKYTISLRVDNKDGGYQVYVLFKHAIEMFWTNPNAQAETEKLAA